MAPDIINASESKKECILTGTPFGSATHSRYASGSEEVSGSDDVSGSKEASSPATASQSASSDEADNGDYTPAPVTGVPTLVADHPN